jgi:hypothetical protein
MIFFKIINMKKLVFLLIIFAAVSCEKEKILGPATTVNLNLNATFDGQPLVIGKSYDYPDDNKIKFNELNFFVANVTLLEAETDDELDLLEVGLADFSKNTDPANVQPATFSIRSVPAVKYRGVRISIGVPSKFNKASILDFGAGHPVRQAYDTHFWKDAGSFFFMKLGGVYDLNGDGVFGSLPEDHPFEHFPMKNPNFKTLTLLKTFNFEEGKTFNLDLSLDVMKLYIDPVDGKPLDLENTANLSTYNPENTALSTFFMSNVGRALTVK